MYNVLNSFFIRSPHLSIKELKEKLFEAKILSPCVQEAIYIASPVLYTELQKYLAGAITNTDERQRIESSLYRYINRMSSRCTPFGLFAGCSTGSIVGDNTTIVLKDYNRCTRLDMYFLCTLSQELSKLSEIREKIKYYPNTTLYPMGKKYRYIEYQYKNSGRIHRVSSVERSGYLYAILKKARKGVRLNEIMDFLVENGIDREECLAFIEELIDSQIIVNELSPSVTGDDYFALLIHILEELHINEVFLSSLKEIQAILHQLDFEQKNNIELYQNIIQKIEEIKIPYEENFLFQVDITRNVASATLGKDIINELQSAMVFLNKITSRTKNETLYQFQQAFYSRYEDQEIPLMEALDPEIGIGYPVNKSSGNLSPLLENFYIPGQVNQGMMSFQPDVFLSLLFKKTLEVLKQNEKEVVLSDEDVKKFTASWDDLPPTMYSMFEILKQGSDQLLLHLTGFSGASGANLFARFAHIDEKMNEMVNEIAAKEQELMPDILLAEIAHLPDSRVGNILSRPHIRDYEILYLANSDLPENRLIYMSDLFLSIRQGRIFLRSKKLNKEIVPRLTNAHNFRNNLMPVYRFLCDMQQQQGRVGLFFNWGYLNNELNFLPRVRYKNTILSLATWKVKTEEIKHLFAIKEKEKLLVETKKWREKYPLPQKMLLQDGDNELLVDWEDIRSIQALFSIIKKREMIILTEFLYDPENSIVKDNNGNPYLNECIVAFYKDKKNE
ncbi:MAG: lantibiotic dehydratase family protein [Candidatus Symbiothrix sp.]|jgi:hypothetical protein|nr:lantibiotic dehydratase family protein [Candidatus Symbiothrix sp.]